jgi:hypothetical protein
MSTATKKENTVVLVTSDEGTYTVERAVAEKSGLVKTMMEGRSLFLALSCACSRRAMDVYRLWDGCDAR